MTEEQLAGLWRRACVIAGQQIQYPAANVLTEFALLLLETPSSSASNEQ